MLDLLQLHIELAHMEWQLETHLKKMEEWNLQFTFHEDQDLEESLRKNISRLRLDIKLLV